MNLLRKWGSYKFLPFLFLFIVSCTTKPQYKVEKIYIDGNRDCIKQCEKERNKCEIACKKEYQKCLDNAYKRAEKIYKISLEKFNEKLDRYNSLYEEYLEKYDKWFFRYEIVYNEYQYYSRQCSKDPQDKYACKKANRLHRELETLRYIKPAPPFKPQPPDFKEILENEKKNCINNCNCEEKFDACFSSCGGKIEVKQICIKNCEK